MLTVLLATRNRAPILREVLECYCRLEPPDSGWKLVLIDNGSTDETPDVITGFMKRLPLHSVREPKSGKNTALNTGLSLLEGDLAVFTDDDAFPFQNWLVELRKAADKEREYAIFGGAVIPRWESAPPLWVTWLNQSAVFTISDPHLVEGPLELHSVFGPNMAIRREVFEAGTRFDTSIGPSGSSYAMGSETELVLRLGRQGHKAWYVQRSCVEHFIRKEQLKKLWVLERAKRFGRGQYRLYGPDESDDTESLMGAPRYLFRKLLKQGLLIFVNGLLLRSEPLFRARWRFNFFRGQIAEARILAEQRSATSAQ
jgi:glycosyltransferase involved in cell wall biosynthesis